MKLKIDEKCMKNVQNENRNTKNKINSKRTVIFLNLFRIQRRTINSGTSASKLDSGFGVSEFCNAHITRNPVMASSCLCTQQVYENVHRMHHSAALYTQVVVSLLCSCFIVVRHISGVLSPQFSLAATFAWRALLAVS